MALLFVDSFDHLSSHMKWTGSGLTLFPNSGQGLTPGRTGRYTHVNWTGGSYSWRVTPNVFPTVCLGVAVRPNSIASLDLNLSNTRMYHGGNPQGIKADVHLGSDAEGRLQVSFGRDGGTQYYSPISYPCLTSGEWYFIELWSHVYHIAGPGIDQAFADVKVRVNEEEVINATIAGWSTTSAPAMVPGQEGFTRIYIGQMGAYNDVDDLYVTDGEFLGDIRIYIIRPNAPGDESDWGAYGAASLWEATLNPGFEIGNTTDNSYARAYSSDVGKSFLVNFQDIEPLGPIMGLQVNYVNTKSNPGSAAFVPRMKISGSIYEHSKTIYPSWGSWYDRVVPLRKNPVTGENWTVADVNSIQAGARRTL
jgi:hypothetical protein